MIRSLVACAFAAAMAAVPAAAFADVILNYTGPNYNYTQGVLFTTSDNVTGTLTLAAPLTSNLNLATVSPLSFSFNDGADTITNANASASSFKFTTDASGSITGWTVSMTETFSQSSNATIGSADYGSYPFYSHGDAASNTVCPQPLSSGSCSVTPTSFSYATTGNSAVGTFTLGAQSVPEPMSVLVLATGVAALVPVSRRRRARRLAAPA